ncbi:MAG: ABC transporter ATP-binding protein/permease [Candidatus Sumerlaeaceae bacterium]|nr:ABC transporter ATP-binding protein/permease [Candidatus Sumerlaeaceae bacterium]
MAKKRVKRNYTDFALYRRLLTYLRGTRHVVVLLVTCMLLEGAFTVVTISLVRPTLDLLVKNRITDSSKIRQKGLFEIGAPVKLEGDRVAVRAIGDLVPARAAEELRDIVEAVGKPPTRRLIIDLSPATTLGDMIWGELYYAKVVSLRGTEIVVLLPAHVTPPEELRSDNNFRLIGPRDPLATEILARDLKNVPLPKISKPKKSSFVGDIKARIGELAAPYLEKLQQYVMVSNTNKFRVLGGILILLVVSALCMVTASFGVGYLSAYMANLCVTRLRNHVLRHLLHLDMAFYNRRSIGNLMSVVTQDVAAVSGSIDILFSNVLKTPITVSMLIGAMFFVSPKLTLYSLTVAPLIGLLLYGIGRRVRKISQRIQELRAVLSSIAQESFSGIRVVKAFNMEEAQADHYERESWTAFRRSLKTVVAEELGTGLTAFLGVLTVAVMILLGGYYVLQTRELSGSEFVLFVVFLSQIFRPLKGSSRVISKIQRGMAGSDRVFRVLDTKPTIVDDPLAPQLPPLSREIRFERVWFRYNDETDFVLRDIDFTVAAKRAIAIVGETGSGKTTLISLLPRFFDPTQGRVLFDDVDIRTVRLRSLRDHIALISQDVVLFDDTVARNIAYGMPDDTPLERIIEAAKAANAHDFIMRLPKGYETLIGGRGVRLSGGERQRISIARAFLKNAPILILDEATSQLDAETEALIQQSLHRIMKQRTVFVVAHRLATILHCDEIIVLDAGRIVERGTHHELLQRGGRYARYYELQFATRNGNTEDHSPSNAPTTAS